MSIPARSGARISVNQMGEYLSATPARRRSIVRDQKVPRQVMVAWYASARQTIAEAIASGNPDGEALWSTAVQLYNKNDGSDFEKQLAGGSADAIGGFINMLDKLSLDGMSLELGDPAAPKLEISGVEISVRPEVIIKTIDKRGAPVVGAIKLYFAKNDPLSPDTGAYISTLVHKHGMDYLASPSAAVSNNHCWVIDVFAGNIHVAPSAFKKRMSDVAAACEEIKLWWERT